MTKIYRVGEPDGTQRFFADRDSALDHARRENSARGEEIEVEMITLIKANPAVLAVTLLEGGYCADAKVVKVYKRKRE